MEAIEIINTINGFYDQAFNKLIAVTFGIIAFIGVIIPSAVVWIQFKSLQREKESLKDFLRDEAKRETDIAINRIDEIIKKETDNMKSDLEARINQIQTELAKASANAEARAFHLQAVGNIESKHYASSIVDFSHAACKYLECHSEGNAQICLTALIDECLPNINKSHFNDADFKIEESIKKIIEKLKILNSNGRYDMSIRNLEKNMRLASERNAPTPMSAHV